MLSAAANCDSLTGGTKICHKELSFKGNSPNDSVIKGAQRAFKTRYVFLYLNISRYIVYRYKNDI